jgi:hypothetical protein
LSARRSLEIFANRIDAVAAERTRAGHAAAGTGTSTPAHEPGAAARAGTAGYASATRDGSTHSAVTAGT